MIIENEMLAVQWDHDTGRVSLTSIPSKNTFVSDLRLSADGGAAKAAVARHPIFGQGKAIEVLYSDRHQDTIMIFPNLPFALFRSSLHNHGNETRITPSVKALSARVNLNKPAGRLTSFGTGGLLAPDKNPGSYVWLAIAEPETRNGVVFGWLTHERGSGVVFSKIENDAVRVNANIEYGKLRLAPGTGEDLETLAIGYFDDARLGLEQWADALARVHEVNLPPQPTGYCTWYSRPHGGASDEKRIVELAEFAARELAPFGFSVVQIDDGWQAGLKRSSPSSPKKNFTTHEPSGRYPSGMKAAAEQIKALGLAPGIWYMPFAGTFSDPFFENRLEWFVKTPAGEPYDTPWGGTSLDMTHPGARAHVRDITRRICREWGYDYIKIDGLWTGAATKQLYVNSGYKADDIGEAVFHNPEKTNVEAYRDGLKLVREAAGEGVFILGCNGPQNMRSYGGAFGLVDGMRVGPDNGPAWDRLLRGVIFGSRHYFLHGRVWYNDPDPVYVRDSMPLNHAQLICSWAAISGQLNLSSEWLPGLPQERLDILKRTMPGHGLLPRPVDLLETDPPRIWLLTDAPEQMPRRDVIGLFNWSSAEQTFDDLLDRLGLDKETEYVVFDYWQDALLPSVKGRWQIAVPAESCRILTIRPRAGHPRIISTSRHVTQGIVDVVEESWYAAEKTLRGRSKIVGGDPYELRIAGGNFAASQPNSDVSAGDKAAGVTTTLTQEPQLIRAKLESPANREVSWQITFR